MQRFDFKFFYNIAKERTFTTLRQTPSFTFAVSMQPSTYLNNTICRHVLLQFVCRALRRQDYSTH